MITFTLHSTVQGTVAPILQMQNLGSERLMCLHKMTQLTNIYKKFRKCLANGKHCVFAKEKKNRKPKNSELQNQNLNPFL